VKRREDIRASVDRTEKLLPARDLSGRRSRNRAFPFLSIPSFSFFLSFLFLYFPSSPDLLLPHIHHCL
jgi:hypothetical protein